VCGQSRCLYRHLWKYSALSIMTGPRFLSDGQTISWLLFFMEWRQLYCSLVRFVLARVVFVFIFFCRDSEKFVIAFSITTGASGGFQVVGM